MALAGTFYPSFGVARLHSQQGQRWAELIEGLRDREPTDPHIMAFSLTMRRLRKRYNLAAEVCEDPFCAVCAAHVVEHFTGTEDELIGFYRKNLDEIRFALKHLHDTRIERVPLVAVAVA